MAAFDFIQLQNTLKAAGFYDFILPWLLAFSIVFGVLQTVNVFKKGDGKLPNTSVDGIISLVVAFYLTLFTPYQGFLSSFFSKLFGSSIIVLSGVLMLLIFVGIFGFQSKELFQGTKTKYVVLAVALVLAAGLFFNANSGIFSFGGVGSLFSSGGDALTLIVFLAVIALVMWYIVHEGKGGAEETPAKPVGKDSN
ncbi:MAG: hypothetical protein V1836_03605 [Candidatus Aenigmatarchaeota archaeon]